MTDNLTTQVQNTFGFMDLNVADLTADIRAAGITDLTTLTAKENVAVNRMRMNAEDRFVSAPAPVASPDFTAQVERTFGYMDLDIAEVTENLTAAGFTDLVGLTHADYVTVNRIRLNAEDAFRAATRRARNGGLKK